MSLREINQLAMAEHVKKEHPGNIHLWWNRSPIASSEKLLQRVLQNSQPEECGNVQITIVDPFSGSGCLTLAALSAEVPVMSGDLNPVAALITMAVSDIPSRFAGQSTVSSDAELCMYSGSAGLAEDIRCYGNWIRKELYYRLVDHYPESMPCGEDNRQVYAWIWTRTAPCPNPACGCRMPLSNGYVLSQSKGRECHVEPRLVDDHIAFQVLPGAPEDALLGNKIGKQGAQFQCPKCGTITKDEYIKNVGKAGQLGLQLMAVGYVSDEGKTYASAAGKQEEASTVKMETEAPAGAFPHNTRWFSPPLFGLNEYADIYTPRQIILFTTLGDLVKEAQKRCYQDALAAGLPDDSIPLVDGGTGALAYSQAIEVYLALVVGKLANYQSEMCTWDSRNGNIRAAFTRQALPMTWVFAEGNPFSSATGNYDAILADVVSTVKNLPSHRSAQVLNRDALQFSFPENSMLFTELPYYDNVGYADLSDYFYIWLRNCLKDVLPGFFHGVVTSKEELSSIPEHYNGDAELAVAKYNEGLQLFFHRFHEAVASEHDSIVFFEFGRKDETAMRNQSSEDRSIPRWEAFMEALIGAGFQITAIWPARTEPPKDRYETSRVAVIFRPRKEDASQTLRRTLIGELKRELPGLLRNSFAEDMDEWDRPIVGMGEGLSLFTRYASVLNADGTKMTVRDALQIIWTEVTEYITSIEPTESQAIQEEETIHG